MKSDPAVHDGSDQELAFAAAKGDGPAFAALLERHYDRIYRMAWRLLGVRADAEDVAQDVCVKLAGAIRAFRADAEFTTWLWRVTHNAATDRLRARQRVRSLDPSEIVGLVEAAGDAAWCAGGQAGGVSALDDVEGRELWETVRRLPGQQRDAVLLVYGEDMSHAEAAGVMGCSEKTVSWHLHEAKKRLKTMLEAVS